VKKKTAVKKAAPRAGRTGRTVRKTARRKKSAARKPVPPAPRPAPTSEEVATAAYYKHLQRRAAGLPDDPAADWLEAERELRRA
jgi:hypothetical protein